MQDQFEIRRLATSMALILGTIGVANSVRAAGPEPDPVINVEIDVADMPAKRDALAQNVAAELARRLGEQRKQLPPGVFVADDRLVIIELRPSPIPDSDDVFVHVIVELDGEKLAESMTEPCLTCSDVDVGGKAMTLMLPLLAELPAPDVAEPPAPAAVEPAEEPLAVERPRTGQTKLISGGVLLGAGLVGVGVGAGLIAADERVVSDPEALDLDIVKYREVGIATLAIGGAAAVTGAVLLGLGLRARSRLAVAPVVGPRVVGLSLGGRF